MHSKPLCELMQVQGCDHLRRCYCCMRGLDRDPLERKSYCFRSLAPSHRQLLGNKSKLACGVAGLLGSVRWRVHEELNSPHIIRRLPNVSSQRCVVVCLGSTSWLARETSLSTSHPHVDSCWADVACAFEAAAGTRPWNP